MEAGWEDVNEREEGTGKGKEEEGEGQEKGEEKKEQQVYVLRGGFVEWQERFGEDARLTEGYEKALWKHGYWG